MRMATVITAWVCVRTSDMRCNVHGARSLVTRSARPMGATRIAWLAPGDGRLTGGWKIVRCSLSRVVTQNSYAPLIPALDLGEPEVVVGGAGAGGVAAAGDLVS
jgi:hypothetical protein